VTRPDPEVLAALGRPLAKARAADPVIAGAAPNGPGTPAAPNGPGTPAAPSGALPAAAVGRVTKLTIRLDEELLGRARAAFFADGPRRGFSSLSAWLADVIDAKVADVERRHNAGAPFVPIGTDVLPKGRMGSL